jgi:hypothetical protein
VAELYLEAYALRRSGCHAILNWIFNQLDQPVLFFNNALPHQDPLWRMRSSGDLQNIVDCEPYYHERIPRTKIIDRDEKYISTLYEDFTELSDGVVANVGWIRPERVERIMIFRDFHNWMASRVRWTLHRKMKMDEPLFIWRWKMYAHHFLYTDDLVKIYHGLWMTNPSYRKSILDELGLNLVNDDISHVPNFGGGSSFSPVSYGAKARTDWKLGERYLYLKEHPELKAAIDGDDELSGYINAVEHRLEAQIATIDNLPRARAM